MTGFLTTSERMLNIEEHSFKTIHKSVTIVIEKERKITIDPREHPSKKCASDADNSHRFLEQSSVKETNRKKHEKNRKKNTKSSDSSQTQLTCFVCIFLESIFPVPTFHKLQRTTTRWTIHPTFGQENST